MSQEAIDLLSVLIQKSEFPIPGQAAYRCDVFEPGGRCPCFQALDANGVSLVTFGVGLGVDCSQGLWIALHARADFLNLKIKIQLESPPRTLWLGVLLEPALLAGSPAMEWLKDFDQAGEVLLVAASRRASESAVVRQYAAEDLGLTAAEWVGRSVTGAKLWF